MTFETEQAVNNFIHKYYKYFLSEQDLLHVEKLILEDSENQKKSPDKQLEPEPLNRPSKAMHKDLVDKLNKLSMLQAGVSFGMSFWGQVESVILNDSGIESVLPPAVVPTPAPVDIIPVCIQALTECFSKLPPIPSDYNKDVELKASLLLQVGERHPEKLKKVFPVSFTYDYKILTWVLQKPENVEFKLLY